MNADYFQFAEFLYYVVTVIGAPIAIAAFILEKRNERQANEEEVHQRLSDQYISFLKLALQNSDLQLLRTEVGNEQLTDEQNERKYALFEILISLFEWSYILVYDEKMSRQTRRLWLSWEDYMRQWCRRKDFRDWLPELLRGEDPDFAAHISRIADVKGLEGGSPC